ncbi:hypothetical protein LEN26_016441 [Aphanomyces euteiches]|nr:hypothetical protein LEN26_016441 [Aphanomyces euteiches]
MRSIAKPSQKPRKPRTTFEVRQREELRRLRAEVETLKDKLRSLDIHSKSQEKMSFWKRMAQDEKLEKSKAFHENEALREAVDQQATFIDQMKKVFLKKPRLMHHHDVHSAEWQTYRLAATASLRQAAIHAIADRQFSRMNHAFLRAGLFDRTEDFTKAELKFEANGSVIYQLATHVKVPAPRDVVAPTVWDVVGGPHARYLPFGLTETFEQIDASTVYSRIVDSRDLAVRDVLVVRTVLDDALVPQMSVDFVENKWAWGQVTTLDENSCNVTLLVRIGLNEISSDPSAVQCAINTTNRMNKTFPSSLTVKEGDFPIVPNCCSTWISLKSSIQAFVSSSKMASAFAMR